MACVHCSSVSVFNHSSVFPASAVFAFCVTSSQISVLFFIASREHRLTRLIDCVGTFRLFVTIVFVSVFSLYVFELGLQRMTGVGNAGAAALCRSKKDIDRHVQEQLNKLNSEHEVCVFLFSTNQIKQWRELGGKKSARKNRNSRALLFFVLAACVCVFRRNTIRKFGLLSCCCRGRIIRYPCHRYQLFSRIIYCRYDHSFSTATNESNFCVLYWIGTFTV